MAKWAKHILQVEFRFLFSAKFVWEDWREWKPHNFQCKSEGFPLLNVAFIWDVLSHSPASWSVSGLFSLCMLPLWRSIPEWSFSKTWEDRGNFAQQTQTQHFMGHSFLLHCWLVWQVSIYVFWSLAKHSYTTENICQIGKLSANFAERVFG